MSIPGSRVVFGFYGAMGLLALSGFGVVLWLKTQPVVQVEQRSMARLLSNAYQKYRFDNNAWPADALDAAVGFRTENQGLPEKVRKAERDWGLKATMVDPDGDSPMVKMTYERPSPLELKYSLYKSRKR